MPDEALAVGGRDGAPGQVLPLGHDLGGGLALQQAPLVLGSDGDSQDVTRDDDRQDASLSHETPPCCGV